MNMPKCLVSVAGKPIIDRQLELLSGIPQVRMVIGFMEERVVEHVRKLRDDVIFARNPRYASTTTLQSIWLATRGLREPFLAIDGDLIVEPDSFHAFLGQCARSAPPLLGLAPATTDEAVYVQSAPSSDRTRTIEKFQRTPKTELEWTGLAWLEPQLILNRPVAVFECLEPHLPMRGAVVRSLEVDTPGDLERASRALCHDEWPLVPGAAATDASLRVEAQAIAERYWRASENAALGPSELYDRQEHGIDQLLVPRLRPDDVVLDLGCGDGRFTCQVARRCRQVVGLDIAPQLIRSATQRSLTSALHNVSFLVGELADLPEALVFDHALCMGVFTTIPDETRFLALARALAARVKPGGCVLVKDSLTPTADRVLIKGSYAAVYRNEQRYLSALRAAGLAAIGRVDLGTLDQAQTSTLFLMERAPVPATTAVQSTATVQG
ncbi:MAG: methyltransferase domain-containing protein [Planctomycetota bacterium]